jgi:hypothetical protein
MLSLLMISLARLGFNFIKTKDEVFSRFQEFKALVESQTGKKIKILRSNNGGEYIAKEFEGFC